MKHKQGSGLFLFAVITVFCIFALLGLSDNGKDFISNYFENAGNNIENIKNTVFNKSAPSASVQPDAENGNTSAPQNSGIPASNKVVNVPFENADSMKYAVYKNDLICTNKISLMAFDKHGKSKWAVAVSYSKPILKTSGNYILMADKGGKLISVFIGDKMLYTVNTDDIINYASISSKGDVIVITEKALYNSCVLVYNKEGEVIFSRNIGSSEVIAVDMSPSRRIAAALLNTDENISSEIQMWDITSEGYSENIILEDTIAFELNFSGEMLSAVSDSGIYGINQKCKNTWTVKPNSAVDKLISTRADSSGNRISVFDNNADSYIKIYDSHGRLRKEFSSDIIPDFAAVHSSVIAYNNERRVFFGSYTKPMNTYDSAGNISEGILIDSGALVLVHPSSLEFININEFIKTAAQ